MTLLLQLYGYELQLDFAGFDIVTDLALLRTTLELSPDNFKNDIVHHLQLVNSTLVQTD